MFTDGRKPCNRFCWIDSDRLDWLYGLNMLNGEFCVTPNWFPMPICRLVPVRNPCWIPAFEDLYCVTRKFVPVMFVAVWIEVLCTNCPLMKNVGSRFGIAVPASCTFKPLSTPPCPLLDGAAGRAARPELRARQHADLTPTTGRSVIVFDTLRSSAPALARIRLASASFGLYRAYSRSRLFSSASAIASRSER